MFEPPHEALEAFIIEYEAKASILHIAHILDEKVEHRDAHNCDRV
jgi:hypothetical protein